MSNEPNYVESIGESIQKASEAHAALSADDSQKVAFMQIFIRPSHGEGEKSGKAMVDLIGDMELVEMGLTALAANSEDFRNVLLSTIIKISQ